MKIRGKKAIIQDHALLAKNYFAMADVIYQRSFGREMTDNEKQAIKTLEEQGLEHQRQASLFGNSFIMIL